MTESQRFEALRSCVSQAVAAGCDPDDLLRLIFVVVAGSPELADDLVEYLRAHGDRTPVAAATIGLVLNFVATQSAEVTAAVLEAVTAEIENRHLPAQRDQLGLQPLQSGQQILDLSRRHRPTADPSAPPTPPLPHPNTPMVDPAKEVRPQQPGHDRSTSRPGLAS